MKHPLHTFSITHIIRILVNAQLVLVDLVPYVESFRGGSVEDL